MDFKLVDYDEENDIVTFSWTSPQESYGRNGKTVQFQIYFRLFVLNEFEQYR